jgi:hypothetical protein
MNVLARHAQEQRAICNADLKSFYGREIEACDSCPLISNGCACIKTSEIEKSG